MNKGQDLIKSIIFTKKQNKKKVKFNLIWEDFCHNGLTKDKGQRSSVCLIRVGYARQGNRLTQEQEGQAGGGRLGRQKQLDTFYLVFNLIFTYFHPITFT